MTKALELIREQTEDKIIGLEEQERLLNGWLESFSKTNKGDSAVMIGHKYSGKSTIIKKVTEKYAKRFKIIFIDGIFQTNDAQALRFLADCYMNENETHLIIIYNFEQYILRCNQILLYKVLTGTRQRPLFALCVSRRQDCIEMLEKRVRSRLSNKILLISSRNVNFENYIDAFSFFLRDKNEKAVKFNSSIKAFVQKKEVLNVLNGVYNEVRSYGFLKDIVVIFLTYLMISDIESLDHSNSIQILREARETILPEENTMRIILASLTMRQLCILICCVKIVKNSRQKNFIYRDVSQNYHKFSNKYLSSLNVNDDIIIFKELDTLADYGILEKTSSSGQLEFKKSSLQVDHDLIMGSVKDFSPLPTAIMHWLEEI